MKPRMLIGAALGVAMLAATAPALAGPKNSQCAGLLSAVSRDADRAGDEAEASLKAGTYSSNLSSRLNDLSRSLSSLEDFVKATNFGGDDWQRGAGVPRFGGEDWSVFLPRSRSDIGRAASDLRSGAVDKARLQAVLAITGKIEAVDRRACR